MYEPDLDDFYSEIEEELDENIDDEYYHNKIALRMILDGDNYDDKFQVFEFKWENGFIKEVSDNFHHNSIKAANNERIEYEVRECQAFWTSDMYGGDFCIQFKKVSE